MDKNKKAERLAKLTQEERHIVEDKGTEAPFQNAYWNNDKKGVYHCKVCGATLFASERKYDSGTGWPSYDAPINDGTIGYVPDTAHNMERIEAVCATCGAHLGHVFEDGPRETTGLRYCINSASLEFEENDTENQKAA